MTVTTVNPATGADLAEYDDTSPDEVDAILDESRHLAADWRNVGAAERGEALGTLAVVLRDRREDLARLATLEMGKPLAESRAEVEKCAWTCEWFAEHGPGLLDPEPVETGALRTRVTYVPLGVLFAVMPWNFPYWQVIRALAPAVTAGNVVVLKHAPSTTGCALLLADIVNQSNLPKGVLSVVVADFATTPAVSERIITDDRVAAVTLTGSTGAGRAVAAIAGRALKKTVLELGGSDPFIVLADADIVAAADWAVRSRFQNSGQSCIATKRIIVEATVVDDFTDAFLEGVGRLTVGDPLKPGVTIGPLARADLRDAVVRQVQASVDQGAQLLAGGRVVEGPGFFYEPTVLNRVTPDMAVLTEEVFGPAVPLVAAGDADDAIRLANASIFGLGSNIWTADLDRGETLAARIDSGHTTINGMTSSDARIPFGGVKDSGFGRELSRYGLHEFVNIHSVVVNGPSGPRQTATSSVE
jgi:succinate-semialdehyde dehydrogenase / glutarate-semialdehyde dehydrogenase